MFGDWIYYFQSMWLQNIHLEVNCIIVKHKHVLYLYEFVV